MSNIRVGVIGSGSVAWFAHFPVIALRPEFELVAVSSRSAQSAEKARARWGAEAAYSDYRTLIARPDLDLVVVASPNVHHYEQALEAIEAGKHVLVEKPLASTNMQARNIARAARAQGVTIAVGCHMRYWTQHRIARELIQQGAIGELRLVRTSLHESWRLYQENIAMSDYRMNPAEAVAGTMFDQATHRIDLLNYLVGALPTRVVGTVANGVNRELPPEIDDLGIGQITYSNGVQGLLTVDKFSPTVSNITEIYGTRGTIFASSEAFNAFQSVPLAVYTEQEYTMETLPRVLREYRYPDGFWVNDLTSGALPPRWTNITPPRNEPFDDLYVDIAAQIRTGRSCALATPEEAAAVMEVACGLMHSSETGGWVDLPMENEYIPRALRS